MQKRTRKSLPHLLMEEVESSFTRCLRFRLSAKFNVNIRRLIIAIYLLLFIGMGIWSALFFWQTRQEYTQLRLAETLQKHRLAELQEKLREQEKVLERLRNDPAYVELVIRRRLGYSKPDEMIFRFDQ